MVFKTPRIERNLPLHQQIMRRIAPILALVFVLFALAGAFLLYNGSTVSIQQQHFQLLTERSREVESLLEQVSADASALAGRAPALDLAPCAPGRFRCTAWPCRALVFTRSPAHRFSVHHIG